jgi:hypothetical protein
MHSAIQIRSEPELTSGRAPNEDPRNKREHEAPLIEIHLQGMGDGSCAAPIVIDRFPFVLGRRHDCDHALNSPRVSRRHCWFLLRGEEVRVEDLGSTNGTYLNGERINTPQVLRKGDLITLDSFCFQVSFALVTG